MEPTVETSPYDSLLPPGFAVDRRLPLGRHPILTAFPGLDRLPLATRLEPDPEKRERLFSETCIDLVAEDLWMYVAPHAIPPGAPRDWHPRVVPGLDCIVVGEPHLRKSPLVTLYLDVFHELCHVRQRRDGANLFDRQTSYVRRWTEVDAYRFVVEEARQLGIPEDFLVDYLRVEWISSREHRELLEKLGVTADKRARPGRATD